MLKDYSLAPEKAEEKGDEKVPLPPLLQVEDLQGWTQKQLHSLRVEVERHMTGIVLADMDMTKELMVQYQRNKILQEDIQDDNDIPTNQKAQVSNTVANLLKMLTAGQIELHNSERAKALENILTVVLKQFPDVQEKFFEEFNKAISVQPRNNA